MVKNKKNRNVEGLAKPIFNNVAISDHAYDRYRERISEDSVESIKEFFLSAVKNGRIKSIRDNIYESVKGKYEIRFIYMNYQVLGIYEPNELLLIISCSGDSAQRGWHRKQVIGLPYSLK